jgi:DNA-binding Xre family transcriptional regulator
MVNTKSPAEKQGFICIPKGEMVMSVTYNKLFKLLIDKKIRKNKLCEIAGISSSTMTKMGNNGHVTTEVLMKICAALNCGVDDIMEVIIEEE